MPDDLTPKTAFEMTAMLMAAGIQRAYGDLAKAAWAGRLTNADIERIERAVLAEIARAAEAAHEFPAFDARAAVEEALEELRGFFRRCASARVRQ
jgi:hypothetical protein